MRVHIVTPANRHLYTSQIDQMHRQRRQVFVEKRKWTALDNGTQCEIDAYDHDAAVYLLALSDVGDVEGSARLLPSWKPHLFSEVLSGYLDQGTDASGPGIWEHSRWLPGVSDDEETNAQCRAMLLCATAEFAIAHHVDAYVACIETRFLNIFAELGWPLEFLGRPQRFERGKAVAVRFSTGPEELIATRRHFGKTGPVAIELPAWTSAEPIDPISIATIHEILSLQNGERRERALSHCIRICAEDAMERARRGASALIYKQAAGNA